jgi:DNA-binding response OmpR family regulator
MEVIKILVVDDDEDICELTRSFLRKRKYCTLAATSAEEAVRVAREDKPHLVLLDVRLGPDSGLDVLRRIKEIDRRIKVIMVSALNDDYSVNQAKSLGAEDFITKPFTVSQLDKVVAEKMAKMGLKVKL